MTTTLQKPAARAESVFSRFQVALLRLSRGRFVLLRLLSCGDLKLLREVTGKALLCSAVIEFVAPWCYSFGTVLDFFRWLAPRWASSGPARVWGRSCEGGKRSFEEFQRVQRFKRCSSHVQERARAHSRVVLNCPGLDIAHRRLVQSERRYGAEPRPCPGFLGWNLPRRRGFSGWLILSAAPLLVNCRASWIPADICYISPLGLVMFPDGTSSRPWNKRQEEQAHTRHKHHFYHWLKPGAG